MASPVFIGDEVTAAGFRLAGFETGFPKAGEAGKALARARAQSNLIVMTAACADMVPESDLDEALRALAPLLLVIPDINGNQAPGDMETRVRELLGIET